MRMRMLELRETQEWGSHDMCVRRSSDVARFSTDFNGIVSFFLTQGRDDDTDDSRIQNKFQSHGPQTPQII